MSSCHQRQYWIPTKTPSLLKLLIIFLILSTFFYNEFVPGVGKLN